MSRRHHKRLIRNSDSIAHVSVLCPQTLPSFMEGEERRKEKGRAKKSQKEASKRFASQVKFSKAHGIDDSQTS